MLGMNTGQALRFWQSINLDLVLSGETDLSTRQMAILLTIYLEPPPHTVRGLAARLKVTKPVITRALDTMSRNGLVERKKDEADGRNVLIGRTVSGSLFLEKMADRICSQIEKQAGP